MAADNFTRAKLQWLDRIMHDGSLTASTRLVAYEIAQHLNRVSGDAWPAQATIARNLGVNVRTVERGVTDLRAAGYVTVAVEGRSNTYKPVFGHGTPDNMSGSIPGNLSGTPDIFDGNTRHFVHGTPDNLGGLSSLREPTQGTLARPTSDVGQSDRRWHSVRQGLVKHCGSDIVAQWFDKLTGFNVNTSDGEVTLYAPTPFYRDQIENRFGARLIDEWRRVVPSIERMRIVVPTLRAAE